MIQVVFSSLRLAIRSVPVPVNKTLQNLGDKSYSTSQKALPTIYMFTKENCSLCEEARMSLKPYIHRFQLKEIDITEPENKFWYEKYKNDIPAFHMFGNFLFMHRVDTNILEKALEDYECGC